MSSKISKQNEVRMRGKKKTVTRIIQESHNRGAAAALRDAANDLHGDDGGIADFLNRRADAYESGLVAPLSIEESFIYHADADAAPSGVPEGACGMTLITVREWLGPSRDNPRRDTPSFEKLTAFATRLPLPEALDRLYEYQMAFKRRYYPHTSVEFNLVGVVEIPAVPEKTLSNLMVPMIETLGVEDGNDPTTNSSSGSRE